jgi:hypothetical protein
MKKFVLSIFAVSFSLLLHNRGLAANWVTEYWIAYRTDGQNGDGSLASPYNGSTNFDSVIANIQNTNTVPSVINILPGTYTTHGYKYTGSSYWQLNNGWRIKGSGIDQTILKLIDAFSDGSNSSGFNWVICSPFGMAVTNCSVSDLTVDCNYSGVASLTGLTNLTLAGVQLTGDHLSIERVKVINAAGKRFDFGRTVNPESFIITLGAFSANTRATGLLIRDCEVSSFAGGSCTAICFTGNGGSTGTRGIIQNCRVILPGLGGGEFAFGPASSSGVIVENNMCWNAVRGLNADSGQTTNVVIRGNMFLNSIGWGVLLGCGTNSVLENNVIEVTGTNCTGLVMSGVNTNFPGAGGWTIRNNIIRNNSGSTNNHGIAFWNGVTPPNCIFENNRIDSTFLNPLLGSGTGFWFNNTDLAGNNPSGFSMQTARNVVANKP